jgi:hypothetical protein
MQWLTAKAEVFTNNFSGRSMLIMPVSFFFFDGDWRLSDLLDPACEIREWIMTQLDIAGDNPAR